MKRLLVLVVCILAMSVNVQAAERCLEYDRIEKGVDPEYVADVSEVDLCKVVIKAGTETFDFEEAGCQAGYCVSDFEGDSVTVGRVCDESPDCKEISHIELYRIYHSTSVDDPDGPFPRMITRVFLPSVSH